MEAIMEHKNREAEEMFPPSFCLGTQTWYDYVSHLYDNVPARAQCHELPSSAAHNRDWTAAQGSKVPRLPNRSSGDTRSRSMLDRKHIDVGVFIPNLIKNHNDKEQKKSDVS